MATPDQILFSESVISKGMAGREPAAAPVAMTTMQRLQRLRRQNAREKAELERKKATAEGSGSSRGILHSLDDKENLSLLSMSTANRTAPAGKEHNISNNSLLTSASLPAPRNGTGLHSRDRHEMSSMMSIDEHPRENLLPDNSVLASRSGEGSGMQLESFDSADKLSLPPPKHMTNAVALTATGSPLPVEKRRTKSSTDLAANVQRPSYAVPITPIGIVAKVEKTRERVEKGAEGKGGLMIAEGLRAAGNSYAATPAAALSLSQRQLKKNGLQSNSSSSWRTPGRSMSMQQLHSIVVNGKQYSVVGQIGKGGSSKVFHAFDDEDGKHYAIKVVELVDEEITRAAFTNEIRLLQRLQGSRHVIRMFDFELREEENLLLVVMEKGEVDLATYLKTRRNEITPHLIRFHWDEILKCVKVIHDAKIVHSDLKPANFLLVEGTLKLIDFGIASSIPSNKTSIVKECQMGTLSYMSPESLAAMEDDNDYGNHGYKVPLKSDVWSLGCILYNMVYGRTPFEHLRSTHAKMRAICDENTEIVFDKIDDCQLLDVMKCCLERDVKKRWSVNELLKHPYLTSLSDSTKDPSPTSKVNAALACLAQNLNLETASPTTARVAEATLRKILGGKSLPKMPPFESPEATQ